METSLGQAWLVFSRSNGSLLSAGMSYNILFSLFAMLFIAFVGAGLWLGIDQNALDLLIQSLNTMMPGLIGFEEGEGIITAADARQIARDSASVLGLTGAIAFVVAIWTARGAVTVTRQAMRDIFGLGFDDRPFAKLLLRDVIASFVIGIGLAFTGVLAWLSTSTLSEIFAAVGWDTTSDFFTGITRAISFVLIYVIDVVLLTFVIRFLTGADLHSRGILRGTLFGAVPLIVLQLGAGFLLSRVPGNALLASFAVIVGLLLWCRLLAMSVLLTASWIAVRQGDRPHISV